jgi:hypothetical protein
MVRLMRNLFPIDHLLPDAGQPPHPRCTLPAGRLEAPPRDRLTDIRWERVQAIRTALRAGRYDVEARLDDLLDDPPAEWSALGWS